MIAIGHKKLIELFMRGLLSSPEVEADLMSLPKTVSTINRAVYATVSPTAIKNKRLSAKLTPESSMSSKIKSFE